MPHHVPETAGYRILPQADGRRYRFYCAVSGAVVYTSPPLCVCGPQQELLAAWNGGAKQQFNRCRGCGQWVCDAMYNPDTLQCVDCTPLESSPRYCQGCGRPLLGSADNVKYCGQCGTKLRYAKEG